MPCEDEGSHWSGALTSPKHQRLPEEDCWEPTESRREAFSKFFSASRHLADMLILDFWPPDNSFQLF